MARIRFWLRQIGLGAGAAAGVAGISWLLAGLFGGWRPAVIQRVLGIEAILALLVLVGQLGLFRFFTQAWHLVVGSPVDREESVSDDGALTLFLLSFGGGLFLIWLLTG